MSGFRLGHLPGLLRTALGALRRWRADLFVRWQQGDAEAAGEPSERQWRVASSGTFPDNWRPVIEQWRHHRDPARRLAEQLPSGAGAVTAVMQHGNDAPGVAICCVSGKR